MEAQGSSLSSMQNQLIMSLIDNAGSSNQGRSTQESRRQPEYDSNAYTQNTQDANQLREQMVELSRRLQKEMERASTNIDFSYNDEIKALVVTVREATGQRVIREIPSQEAIELMRKMRDMIGNIFDERV